PEAGACRPWSSSGTWNTGRSRAGCRASAPCTGGWTWTVSRGSDGDQFSAQAFRGQNSCFPRQPWRSCIACARHHNCPVNLCNDRIIDNRQNPYQAPLAELTINGPPHPLLASRWPRLGAALIDGLIMSLATVPVAYFSGAFTAAQQGIEPTLGQQLLGL